jgi:hypothetical protein
MLSYKYYLNCGLFYLMRKHYCLKCNSLLEKKKVSKIVNSHSPEAKDYKFSTGGNSYLHGDVKFTTLNFFCMTCNAQYTIEEQIEIERRLRKERRKEKRRK